LQQHAYSDHHLQLFIMKKYIHLLLFLFVGQSVFSQSGALRHIQPTDIYSMKNVSRPKISPEGDWILYSMSRPDSVKDRNQSKLYMVSRDGKETVTLTEQTNGAGSFDWSPDGKYISFMAASKDEEASRQVFLLDRRGGEAIQLTKIKGEVQSYDWRFDGKKLVLAIRESNTADTAKTKVRKPYEINRYQFKQDYAGYLDNRKTHLYLFDVESKKLDTLTRGNHNESGPLFSPDGNAVVYVSNTTPDPDKNSNTDLFLVEAKSGSKPRQLTTFKGANSSPQFSFDGSMVAYLQSSSEDNFNMYDQAQLAMVNLSSGATSIISAAVDRPISGFVWAADNKHIHALVQDDRKEHVVSFNINDLSQQALTSGEGVYSGLNTNRRGDIALLYSDMDTPNEIYTKDAKGFKRVTRLQEDVFVGLKRIYKKGFQSISEDGTLVSGILYLPDSTAKKLPLVLFIHGGPVAQDDFGYDQSREILAGAGFAVAAVNYRGSSGRGRDFCRAIYADWGNKEVKDIIGAANYLVKTGVADPERMGIGGWSYGGILTNYTIATDTRFKAAVSGAGSSLQFSIYGTDQYIKQYNEELGFPWKNVEKWKQLSYPFFKVDQIKTPTLFMASEDDFNVPVAGAEQMYQAFKSEGIPAELVIYPNQNHGIAVPSYIVHRYKRHIDWFKKYLTP
jgi:dipeptidyl aminopeptidase/acylaminoacyl peptidase